ncbi:MAG: tRNA uridine-5-carboxymethylaminomethyl(34) synthesis GTPase MnmE [Spirochaetes bacterium]|nr:tRNA uridine-5-carboxymethylaminomethyl(34) synthesis GTPase MnmE [Spirochaetota bacterium]
MREDTICASATPPINSPLAIIRISGPMTYGAVKSIFSNPEKIKHRTAVFGSVVHENKPVDDVILTYYQEPESFTGEDMAEISCHGNPIIVRDIIRILNNKGIRLAEPGEFSKRSFLNGKIDLTEAEAINHIITAKSDWQVSSALRQMHGSLRDSVNSIRDSIITLKADVESGIDFIEQDIEFVSNEEALRQIADIREKISEMLARCRIGEKMSHGIDLPIVGKPNVGKSSILNTVLNRERAIVSDIPGTTRDLIGEIVQIGGVPVNLTDTAGITKSDSLVEMIGVELSNKKMEASSIIIFVIDAFNGVKTEDFEIYEKIKHKNHIILANKSDLVKDNNFEFPQFSEKAIPFSAKTGKGLADLEKAISTIIRDEFVNYESSFVTDMRIISILGKSLEAAGLCDNAVRAGESQEIIAFELQSLIDIISEITGEISPDDILDSIFSRFCIGK